MNSKKICRIKNLNLNPNLKTSPIFSYDNDIKYYQIKKDLEQNNSEHFICLSNPIKDTKEFINNEFTNFLKKCIFIRPDKELSGRFISNFKINKSISKIIRDKLNLEVESIYDLKENENILANFIIWDTDKSDLTFELLSRLDCKTKVILLGNKINPFLFYLLPIFNIIHYSCSDYSLRSIIMYLLHSIPDSLPAKTSQNYKKYILIELLNFSPLPKTTSNFIINTIGENKTSIIFALLFTRLNNLLADFRTNDIPEIYYILSHLLEDNEHIDRLKRLKFFKDSTILRFIYYSIYNKNTKVLISQFEYNERINSKIYELTGLNNNYVDLSKLIFSKNHKYLSYYDSIFMSNTIHPSEFTFFDNSSNIPERILEKIDIVFESISSNCIENYLFNHTLDNYLILSALYFRKKNELLALDVSLLNKLPKYILSMLVLNSKSPKCIRNIFSSYLAGFSESSHPGQFLSYAFYFKSPNHQVDNNMTLDDLASSIQNPFFLVNPILTAKYVYFFNHQNDSIYINFINKFLSYQNYDKNGVIHFLNLLEDFTPFENH